MKQNFQVEEGDDEDAIIAKIEQGMVALGEEQRLDIPCIKYVLSVDPGDEAVLRMDVRQRRVQLFDALRDIVLKGVDLRPLVLVVEDLH